MSDVSKSDDTARSTQAARSLAETLVAVAEALESNDLATISEAMTAVRVGARQLEASLSARGWGGDVLYGWGEDDEDEFDGNEGDEDDEVEENDGDDEVEETDIPTDAVRFTVQSRSDFYLVDEKALMRHNLRRAADLGLNIDREYLDGHGGAMGGFAELWSLEQVDLTGMGLLRGGSQHTMRQVEETLWEMDERDFELRGDAFPTEG